MADSNPFLTLLGSNAQIPAHLGVSDFRTDDVVIAGAIAALQDVIEGEVRALEERLGARIDDRCEEIADQIAELRPSGGN